MPSEYYRGEGACRVIRHPGVDSCEDARFWDNVDTGERRLVLSCDPGRRAWNAGLDSTNDILPASALWLSDPKTLDMRRIELDGFPEDRTFHPLGFQASPAHSGKASRLFVVNTLHNASVVEEFTLSWDRPTTAHWVRTLDLSGVPAANSIALTSDDTFYVSNDHHFSLQHAPVSNAIETFLALPLTHIEYVHVPVAGGDSRPMTTTVAGSIPFANGIALSPNSRLLAVASTTGTSVRIYVRHGPTNALLFKDEILVPFAPDNLSFDDDGVLLAAGHTDFPALIGMSQDKPGVRSPSWVISLRPTEELVDKVVWDSKAPYTASGRVPPPPSGWEMETLYQSSGNGGFASATTALRDARTGRLFVTGLFEEGLLVCD